MRLQPADPVVDVLERRRIRRLRRVAEFDREHDDAAGAEIEGGVLPVGAVLAVPGAAMNLHDGRKRSLPCWLIQASQPDLVAIPLIDDVADLEFVCFRGCCLLDVGGRRREAGEYRSESNHGVTPRETW